MARCVSCDIVISEFYLKDGMCEDCISESSSSKTLSKSQLEEKIKLKEKYKDLNTPDYLEFDKKTKDIKTKYDIELSIDDYLTMENLLTTYIDILARKKKELVTLDDYGNKKYDLWNQEINYFLQNTFVELLKAQNITIHKDLIKDIISTNVEKYTENNKFIIENNIKSMSNKNVENKNVANGFLILLFIGIIFYIFFGNNKSSSYSDSNYNQQKYENEKAQTLRDIQKAVDEAKYQEWKNK